MPSGSSDSILMRGDCSGAADNRPDRSDQCAPSPGHYGRAMIEVTDDARIRTIRFRRPEAKNAMNTAMWDGCTEAFIDAATDPGVAVVVLTGSEDSFSAGQDLLEMAQMATGDITPEDAAALLEETRQFQ